MIDMTKVSDIQWDEETQTIWFDYEGDTVRHEVHGPIAKMFLAAFKHADLPIQAV